MPQPPLPYDRQGRLLVSKQKTSKVFETSEVVSLSLYAVASALGVSRRQKMWRRAMTITPKAMHPSAIH
jgi:hypothetical protein